MRKTFVWPLCSIFSYGGHVFRRIQNTQTSSIQNSLRNIYIKFVTDWSSSFRSGDFWPKQGKMIKYIMFTPSFLVFTYANATRLFFFFLFFFFFFCLFVCFSFWSDFTLRYNQGKSNGKFFKPNKNGNGPIWLLQGILFNWLQHVTII